MLSFFCIFTYQVELCTECIEWAKEEKRTFLRQALEVSEKVTCFMNSVITLLFLRKFHCYFFQSHSFAELNFLLFVVHKNTAKCLGP